MAEGDAALIALLVALAADPLAETWVRSSVSNAAVARIRPDVHAVEVTEREVVVRSAGISLAYLGPLQNVPKPKQQVNAYEFRFPRRARVAARKPHVPSGIVGAFVNGVPIFNPFEASSYRGQNLWHYDTVRGGAPGLLERLCAEPARQSPIVGFALDGYPIYGPFYEGRRMRSSYRLRSMARREIWPDGTRMAPGQEGPAVGGEYPLGTFAEDYEYVAASGDLDERNGRFAVTPEYPQGTYAYFLATGADGAKAFPYLLAFEYHGEFGVFRPVTPESGFAFRHSPVLRAGAEALLEFAVARHARYLEHVHERPLHLLIVSADLRHFDHVHPEVRPDNVWETRYRFPRGGTYHLYADFAAPGGTPRTEHRVVSVAGGGTYLPAGETGGVRVTLKNAGLRAGEEVELRFALSGAVDRLEPYLGAWAHVVIAEAGLRSFVHAHPLEAGVSLSEVHVHGAEAVGPPPSTVRVVASFPRPGRYRIWVQLQVAGEPRVWPVDVVVSAGSGRAVLTEVPRDAIRIRIDASGYSPSRVVVPAGRPVKLAFVRSGEPNCGGQVAIPSLRLTREVPLGGVAVVELAPQPAGELFLTCGMRMYRGAIVVEAR